MRTKVICGLHRTLLGWDENVGAYVCVVPGCNQRYVPPLEIPLPEGDPVPVERGIFVVSEPETPAEITPEITDVPVRDSSIPPILTGTSKKPIPTSRQEHVVSKHPVEHPAVEVDEPVEAPVEAPTVDEAEAPEPKAARGPVVVPGQVWKDNDTRTKGAGEFTVEAVVTSAEAEPTFRRGKSRDARVTAVIQTALANPRTKYPFAVVRRINNRFTKISVERMVKKSSTMRGYTYIGMGR